MQIVIAALGGAGFVFFLVNFLFARFSYKNATLIERTNAEIEASQRRNRRATLSDRWRQVTIRLGWGGSGGVILAGAGFVYAAVVLALLGFGVASPVAVSAALPACLGVSWIVVRSFDEKRQESFRRQLLEALNLIVGQMESGSGAQRALEQIVSQLDNPLREELERVLGEARASKDLVAAMRDMEKRYPSRALSMVVAAYEIDQLIGGALVPVLRQAAGLLEREFALTSEAMAEVAQTRMEFYIVTGIILGIAFFMITGSGAAGTAFLKPTGIIVLAFAGGNFLLGIYRVLRLLASVKGQK